MVLSFDYNGRAKYFPLMFAKHNPKVKVKKIKNAKLNLSFLIS